MRDHLHIRGEYKMTFFIVILIPGSPPHTWRILQYCNLVVLIFRITSTYVENTKLDSSNLEHSQDHLHIRGEYSLSFDTETTSTGSPPHTWRILVKSTLADYTQGITSTYVENTAQRQCWHSHHQDHLHIRGEYYFWWVFNQSTIGSPPHTWRILIY